MIFGSAPARAALDAAAPAKELLLGTFGNFTGATHARLNHGERSSGIRSREGVPDWLGQVTGKLEFSNVNKRRLVQITSRWKDH